MSDEIEDLDEMLGFLGEDGRQRRDPEEHPSPEELSAYQANELTPEEDERIQDHLALCQHCTELLLDLEEFLTPPAVAAEPAADFEAAADWKRLREGMGPVAGKPEPLRVNVPTGDYRMVRSLRTYKALAAVLAAMVIGLSWHAWRDQGQLEILPPQRTIHFATTRASGQAEKPLEIRLPFGLGFSTSAEYPEYRVQIFTSDGRLRYSADTALSKGIIPLETGVLSPGTYTIKLSGLKDGQSDPIGDAQNLVVQP